MTRLREKRFEHQGSEGARRHPSSLLSPREITLRAKPPITSSNFRTAPEFSCRCWKSSLFNCSRYHIAVRRGCDVDQPRNLAKSVTVE